MPNSNRLAFFQHQTTVSLNLHMFVMVCLLLVLCKTCHSATCSVRPEGEIKCWGTNYYGQCGVGSDQDVHVLVPADERLEMRSLEPVNLGMGRRARYVVTGFQHTCAILINGELVCWGNNRSGQLGFPFKDVRELGSKPSDLGINLRPVLLHHAKVSQVALGLSFTCALLETGYVYCFGEVGFYGAPDQKIIDIAAGRQNVCALLENGDVQCANLYEETEFNLLNRKAIKISSGRDHTCAILEDKETVCWGSNSYGQLGVETDGDAMANEEDLLRPVDMGPERYAISLSAGFNHTCVILNTDEIGCWGKSNDPKLAETLFEMQIVQLGHPQSQKYKSINAYVDYTCVTLDNEELSVVCWGLNDQGQCGTGTQNEYVGTITGGVSEEEQPVIEVGFGLSSQEQPVIEVGFGLSSPLVLVNPFPSTRLSSVKVFNKGTLDVFIHRDTAKAEFFGQLSGFDRGAEDFDPQFDPHFLRKCKLFVKFEGENAIDYQANGGPKKELFELVAKQALSSNEFRYIEDENLHVPLSILDMPPWQSAPLLPSQSEVENLKKDARHFGMFIAMALTQKKPINQFFKLSFYKLMLGEDLTLADLKSDGHGIMYKSLQYYLLNDVSDLEWTFTVTVAKSDGLDGSGKTGTKVIELIENGENVAVTNENKKNFVTRMARWYMYDHARAFYDAFLGGFHHVVTPADLEGHTPLTLKTHIGGIVDFDVTALHSAARPLIFAGSKHPCDENCGKEINDWFWAYFEKPEGTSKERILKFITGSSTVPATGLLMPITVRINRDMSPTHLPRSSTCFNLIYLPVYESDVQFYTKMQQAMEYGGDAMDGEYQ